MKFPVEYGIVTTGYFDPRPYSVPPEERKYFHRAWDISADPGSAIKAPEDGRLYFHSIHRSPQDKTADWFWNPVTPSGQAFWYMFSNFYYDAYGACTVLLGEKYVWLFAHQEEQALGILMEFYSVIPTWQEKRLAYNDYVRAMLTFGNGIPVVVGSPIGKIGNAGYSTGPHVHMQVHKSLFVYEDRVDPGFVWPSIVISNNGKGPGVGPSEQGEVPL